MQKSTEVRLLRIVRKIHRWIGVSLFLIMILVALSGLLLGWKKNLSFVQQPTRSGQAKELTKWLSMDSLVQSSQHALMKQLGEGYSWEVDKIDAYPKKGIVKVIYASHYYSCQVDAATGEVLSIEYRLSDLVEHLHDGSWVDRKLGWSRGTCKLLYTSTAGGALFLFSVTGFWLWLGPIRLRNRR